MDEDQELQSLKKHLGEEHLVLEGDAIELLSDHAYRYVYGPARRSLRHLENLHDWDHSQESFDHTH